MMSQSEMTATPEENSLLRARIYQLQCLFLIFPALVLARVFYFNIIQGEDLEDWSKRNIHREVLVDSPRGVIYDNQGQDLATDRLIYNFYGTPFQIPRSDLERTVTELETLTGQDYTSQSARMVYRRIRGQHVDFPGLEGLSQLEAMPILERIGMLPGLSYEVTFEREYPTGPLFSHLIGYVRPYPYFEEKDNLLPGYTLRDRIGARNLERVYESRLRGKMGTVVQRRDSVGRVVDSWTTDDKTLPGRDLYLTLDARLQAKGRDLLTVRLKEILEDYRVFLAEEVTRLEEALAQAIQRKQPTTWFENIVDTYKQKEEDLPAEPSGGCLIAMEPKTGRILTMISYPDYNPLAPSNTLDTGDSPMRVSKIFAYDMPGSAFKLVGAYGFLKNGFDPEMTVNCRKYYYIKGWNTPYRCDGTHADVNLIDAIQKSCNVYFYTIVNEYLGAERFSEAARDLGFGLPTGIDCVTTETVRPFPNLTGPGRGELLYAAIGQGKVQVSPLQVLRAYSAIANGGYLVQPRVVERIENRIDPSEGIRYDQTTSVSIHLQPLWREILMEGLWRVINEKDGTAYEVESRQRPHKQKFPKEWNAVGKTSSAEKGGQAVTNGWFVCLAPREDPIIAVLAMTDKVGHGGDFAAPLCKEWLEEYFKLYPPDFLKPSQPDRPAPEDVLAKAQ